MGFGLAMLWMPVTVRSQPPRETRPCRKLDRPPGSMPTAALSGDSTLRFLDDGLERRYQRAGGAESLTGFQITTGTAALMWLLAALFVPSGTPIPIDRAVPLCGAMALLNWTPFLFSEVGDHARSTALA